MIETNTKTKICATTIWIVTKTDTMTSAILMTTNTTTTTRATKSYEGKRYKDLNDENCNDDNSRS